MLTDIAIWIALPFVFIMESLVLLAEFIYKIAVVVIQFYLVCLVIAGAAFVLAIIFIK